MPIGPREGLHRMGAEVEQRDICYAGYTHRTLYEGDLEQQPPLKWRKELNSILPASSSVAALTPEACINLARMEGRSSEPSRRMWSTILAYTTPAARFYRVQRQTTASECQ